MLPAALSSEAVVQPSRACRTLLAIGRHHHHSQWTNQRVTEGRVIYWKKEVSGDCSWVLAMPRQPTCLPPSRRPPAALLPPAFLGRARELNERTGLAAEQDARLLWSDGSVACLLAGGRNRGIHALDLSELFL